MVAPNDIDDSQEMHAGLFAFPRSESHPNIDISEDTRSNAQIILLC